MCSFAAVARMPFLQCLHCWRSGTSSRGRPVANVSWLASSSLLMMGLGEPAAMIESSLVALFCASAACHKHGWSALEHSLRKSRAEEKGGAQ